jgi:hypothetical protein
MVCLRLVTEGAEKSQLLASNVAFRSMDPRLAGLTRKSVGLLRIRDNSRGSVTQYAQPNDRTC